jgi:hypothetical protein
MTAEPFEEPTELFERLGQIETGDASARSNRHARFLRRRQGNARHPEALYAFGGQKTRNAFGKASRKSQSGWSRLL